MPRLTPIRTLCLAFAAVTAFACDSAETLPSAPTTAGTPAAEHSLVTICHGNSADGSFARLTVPPSAVAGHLEHGDAYPGHFVPGSDASRFDQHCAMTAVVSTRITFNSLTSHGAPMTIVEESGFRIEAVSGQWIQWTGYGWPAPCVVFQRPASGEDAAAEIEVRFAGGLFAFSSIDLYSSVTRIPYTITGRLGKNIVLSMSGTVPNTFGRFAGVENGGGPQMVEVLSILLVNPATPCCANPMGLDNIALKR